MRGKVAKAIRRMGKGVKKAWPKICQSDRNKIRTASLTGKPVELHT